MEIAFDQNIRIFLALFFTAVAVFYSLRILGSRRDVRLIYLGEKGSSHRLGHLMFRIFRASIWGICVARVFYPELDAYLFILTPLYHYPLMAFGCFCLLAGFIVIYHGHRCLGKHWRSGIDPAGPAYLVTDNIYARSRNPMTLGILLSQLGFFLALPSLFSLLCLAVGVVAVCNQVLLEERHLARVFGDRYTRYCRRTPRWW